MTAALDLITARTRAESLMTSTCTIRQRGTEPVTDPDTGAVTIPAGAAVFSGPCRVRPAGTRGTTAEAGAAEVFVFDYLVSIPFAATGVQEGMTCTIDTSLDPALVGVITEVQKVDRGEHITARRLSCNEVK